MLGKVINAWVRAHVYQFSRNTVSGHHEIEILTKDLKSKIHGGKKRRYRCQHGSVFLGADKTSSDCSIHFLLQIYPSAARILQGAWHLTFALTLTLTLTLVKAGSRGNAGNSSSLMITTIIQGSSLQCFWKPLSCTKVNRYCFFSTILAYNYVSQCTTYLTIHPQTF